MELKQETLIRLAQSDIAELHLSVPAWEDLSKPPANRGFVRHGEVARATSYLPKGAKVEYGIHADPFMQGGADHLLLWGARNSMQNLFLPMWNAEATPKLLRREDEPWQFMTYHAFLRRRDSSFAIEEIRFVAMNGTEPQSIEVLSNGDWVRADDVLWAVVGQPVLWDGQLPSLGDLAARTYDLRHIWRLHWEKREGEAGDCDRDAAIHAELMDLLWSNRETPVETRGCLLGGVAAEYGLTVEDGYLHSSMGVDAQGNIILLAKHASLHDLGSAQRSAGACRAILLDNGGSVGYAYSVRDRPLRFVGNGSYFRPVGHAVIVATLRHSLVEKPFCKKARLGFAAAAISHQPASKGDTFVDAVGCDLRGRAETNVDILFDGPYGQTHLAVPRLPDDSQADAACAELAAVAINNHAMLLGVRGARILADDGFVHSVRRRFKQRFDRVQPGAGIESGCVSDYLSVFNDHPFEIRGGAGDLPSSSDRQAEEHTEASVCATPDALAIGVDIGSGNTKILLTRGSEELKRTEFSTRNTEGPTTTQYLLSTISKEANELCSAAGVQVKDVACMGVTWPGAVRAGCIAGSSNLLREMEDLQGKDGNLNLRALAEFRDLPARIRECIGIGFPVYLINDGGAIASFLAGRQSLRNVLFVQLGTSIAGGYVDGLGRSGYLAELSRFVLDLATNAPVHTFTRITGLSRQTASGAALKRLLTDAGIEDFEGMPLTRFNPGEFASAILGAESTRAFIEPTRNVVKAVGRNLGRLLACVSEHLPLQHVLLSGGLISNSGLHRNDRIKDNRLVQPIVRATWEELHKACPNVSLNVVEASSGRVSCRSVDELGDAAPTVDRHLGAMAAADYALHTLQD